VTGDINLTPLAHVICHMMLTAMTAASTAVTLVTSTHHTACRLQTVDCRVCVMSGNSTIDDLMMHLMHTVEMFRQQLNADIVEEVSD